MQLLTYGYATSGCAGQAERPLQASRPERPPGHCWSYWGETQPLMMIILLMMTIMAIMVTRYDADDLNDPLGNSRSHRSETQSHFLSIRQFSPHCQPATGRSSVLHFEPNLAEDLCFVPTHQLASVSTSVSPTVHQSGPINPFSEHCGHNFSPPRHPAIINKVPTCFLSQRALFQKIIWGNPPVLS